MALKPLIAGFLCPSGGGAAPGGASGAVQYNNSGAFGGLTGLTTVAGVLTNGAFAGGTVVANAPILDLSQTWNNAGVTFTGEKSNVTDTASAAASLVRDWQVNGSTVANIRKDGQITAGGFVPLGTQSKLDANLLVAGGVNYAAATGINWSVNSNPNSGSFDLTLSRSAAGVFRIDGTAVVSETVVSDRTLAVNINGTAYKFCLKV